MSDAMVGFRLSASAPCHSYSIQRSESQNSRSRPKIISFCILERVIREYSVQGNANHVRIAPGFGLQVSAQVHNAPTVTTTKFDVVNVIICLVMRVEPSSALSGRGQWCHKADIAVRYETHVGCRSFIALSTCIHIYCLYALAESHF